MRNAKMQNAKCKMRKCKNAKCKMRKKQSHSLPSLRGGAKPPAAAWGWGYFTIPFSKYSARLQRTF